MQNDSIQIEMEQKLNTEVLLSAYTLMCNERAMTDIYEANREITKYVHSTSRGHEAVQIAAGMCISAIDGLAPYYRDAMMLQTIGMQPYELMLQLLAKKDDPFSGGRSYYSHPSLRREGFPLIPHQSSATGMQVIPATGMAHAIKYLKGRGRMEGIQPIVLCSLGDGSVTEGEVSEALQQAVLHNLPILYLIQDNEWGISVSAEEMRTMNAYEYAAGFKGLERVSVNGSDFMTIYPAMQSAFEYVRSGQGPMLLHATCPLLAHHTSGVRREFYRSAEDLAKHGKNDPIAILEHHLINQGIEASTLEEIQNKATEFIASEFKKAVEAPDPELDSVLDHIYAPSPITEEVGTRSPEGGRTIIMVDAALYAVQEIMESHEEAILYGQDVGGRLGGVFREAATLADKFGVDRVFNTPIQEAYIIGSTVGMSAMGVRPFVEVQFCDYIFPGINQLYTELAKSYYLSNGKFPASAVIRVPIGAYGGGGPYHSGSHESVLTALKGIKVVYPSNAADMKGLMKSAWYDPNPVVMLEHKGLYWSKVPGTEAAKTIEPSADYCIPLGKGRIALHANQEKIDSGESMLIITYGMGVHWSLNAAKEHLGHVEIIDLRTLQPLDEELIYERTKIHGKVLVLTEEQISNSFAQSVAARIGYHCFQYLDQPVHYMGALDVPAIALNIELEKVVLPNKDKVSSKIKEILEG